MVRLASRHAKTGPTTVPTAMGTQMVQCDVTQPAAVASAIDGSTHVVNLVGILHETPGTSSTFNAIQAEAPSTMARFASRSGVRNFVHVSAIGADATSDSPYARTKAIGEERVSMLAEDPETDVTILRPSIVFGPEDAFFNRFDAMAKVSPALPLVGGGETRFQPVHVDDVAQAIVTSLKLNSAADRVPVADEASIRANKGRPSDAEAVDNGGGAANMKDNGVNEGIRSQSTTSSPRQARIYELGGASVLSFKELMQLLLRVTNRQRVLLPVPFPVAHVQGGLFEAVHRIVPQVAPMLTRDQVTLLKRDNVVSVGARTFADLGLTSRPCDEVNLAYLRRWNRITTSA